MVKTMKQYLKDGRCKDSKNVFQVETTGYKYKMYNIEISFG